MKKALNSVEKFPSENPNPVLRISKAGELLYANAAARPILKAMGALRGRKLKGRWKQTVQKVYSSGQATDMEIESNENVFSMVLMPIEEAGCVNVYGYDVTARKEADEEERERLARMASQLEALIKMAGIVTSPAYDRQAAFELITRIAAETIGVERSSIWLLSEDKLRLVCACLYEKTPGAHSSGTELAASDYPAYFAAVETAEAIDASDALTDERTRELKDGYLKPLHITSILDAPVRLSGGLAGVICLEHTGEMRSWHADEVRSAAEAANQVSQAITEDRRRLAERTLRASEVRNRTILQTAPSAIVAMDEDELITGFNAAAERIFGYRADEVLGRKVEMLMPERYSAKHNEAIRRLIATGVSEVGGKTREYEALGKDGAEFPISITMSPAKIEGHYTFLAIISDITERRKTEQQMKTLSTAIEHSVNIVFITDIDGVIKYVNPKFEEVTGYTRDEAVGQTPRILSSGETSDAHYEELWSTILSGRTYRQTIKNRKKDGGHYWSSVVVSPIQDGSGKITHFLAVQEDITKRMDSEKRLQRLSAFDELTGLMNRARFMELLADWIKSAEASGPAGSDRTGVLLLMDIDEFKFLNDTYGHAIGDEFLRRLAERLKTTLRGLLKKHLPDTVSDTLISRPGGDEFVVFLPSIDAETGISFAEEIRKAVESIRFKEDYGALTVSMGVVEYPSHGTDTRELFTRVDAAMYRAKELGRNRCHLYRPEDRILEKMHSRIQWKERILKALKEDRFEPWFQPILDLKTNTVHHYEALARMRDVKGRVLLPGAFIEVAERFGLVGAIDRVIIEKVMKLQALMKQKGEAISFSVNLSGKDLGDKELLAFLKSAIKATGADPFSIVFEITETAAVGYMESAIEFIEALNELGCRFALDDFGVGFTSFTYLKRMNIDFIKIDGSFIRKLNEDPTDQIFVKAMTEVARGLGIRTIAEFVENSETLGLLKGFGVDFAQGYHIGKPSPALEYTDEVLPGPTRKDP